MHTSNFQLELYLKRIGFTGVVAADSETVKALMQQQLRSVALLPKRNFYWAQMQKLE